MRAKVRVRHRPVEVQDPKIPHSKPQYVTETEADARTKYINKTSYLVRKQRTADARATRGKKLAARDSLTGTGRRHGRGIAEVSN